MRAFILLALLAPIMAFEVEKIGESEYAPFSTDNARIMEDKITNFLECVRDILKNGDDEFGFPSFNPLEIPEVKIDLATLNLQGLSGTLSLKNFRLSGVPDWKVEKLQNKITIIPLGAKIIFHIKWPKGSIAGDYDADLSIFGHTIKGAGKLDGEFIDFRFQLEAQARVNPIAIKTANVKISLGSSNLVIENLNLDGEDISAHVTAVVANLPELLATNQANINNALKNIIIPAANKIIDAVINGQTGSVGTIPLLDKCIPKKA